MARVREPHPGFFLVQYLHAAAGTMPVTDYRLAQRVPHMKNASTDRSTDAYLFGMTCLGDSGNHSRDDSMFAFERVSSSTGIQSVERLI
jgi:hypothetical protein